MTLYVFDTNSCRVLENYYPDRFPTPWGHFQDAIEAATVTSVREVYDELEHQTSGRWLWDWVKKNRRLFVTPTEEFKKQHAAKVPSVCEHFQVPCTNVEGLLAENGWPF